MHPTARKYRCLVLKLVTGANGCAVNGGVNPVNPDIGPGQIAHQVFSPDENMIIDHIIKAHTIVKPRSRIEGT